MVAKFLLLLAPFLLNSNQSANDLIEWNESRKLSWSDFTGQPDASSPNAALTSSSINVEFGYDRTTLTYSIKCRFNKMRSWGKIKTDYILAHEQGHFDIAEIFARKLNKALKAYKFNSSTVGKDVNAIYDGVIKEQQAYDHETDHSRNPVKQQEWVRKIAEELKTFEKFSNYK